MKLQHIAAAVALAVVGTANAAVSDIASGNSSLFLIAYDNAGGSFTTTSMFADLGFNLTDFTVGAALTGKDQKVVWDFGNNTLTVNGTLSTANNAWSAAFDKLVANSDAGGLKWTIGAGDRTGSGANVNYLVSGQPTALQLTNQTGALTTNFSSADAMYAALTTGAGKGTINSADNGAFTFAAADGVTANRTNGYVVDATAFGTNWQGNNKITSSIQTVAADGSESRNNLWLLNGLGNEARVGEYTLAAGETLLNGSNLLNGVGTFKFNVAAKTLTWETAAVSSVPEASTYAMALVGLAVAGVAARRRRAA